MDKLSLYLEAAYLYYLHPELNLEIMSDLEWDALGKELQSLGVINQSGSLFYLKENDYPEEIRKKYNAN